MPEDHDPYAALRYPDYCLLLSGSVLSALGSQAQTVAIGWEIYKRTDLAAALGFTGLAQFLPVLLLSLPAGQAADRFSRKALIQIAQGVMALASLGLAALSWTQGPIELVYLCLVVAGCGRALSAPSRWALVPLVVPGHLLGNAVTWNSSGWQIASVVGPVLGGLLLEYAGGPATYLLAAGCALTCAALLGPIRPRLAPPPTQSRSLSSLLAGARFVWKTNLLLAAITLDLFAVLLGGATALLPIYAKDILQIGPDGLGYLRGAPALGALLMALVMAHRPPLRRPGLALLLAVAGFGAATIAFGLSDNVVLSFLMLALLGALDNISVVVRGTLMQVLTPDDLRGRVAAVNSIFISSSNELGEFESGMAAQGFGYLAPLVGAGKTFGPIASVVSGGIGTLVVVLIVALRCPGLVRLGTLHAPPVSPEEQTALAAGNEATPAG